MTAAADQNHSHWLPALKAFYRSLAAADLARLPQIYHPDVVFTDPAGRLCGLPALSRHFERLLQNVRACECEFTDEEIADGERAALFWRMTLQTPALAGGKPFSFDGASHLAAKDNKIIVHRDYFDLGAMLYERLPVVGGITRRLRAKLAPC